MAFLDDKRYFVLGIGMSGRSATKLLAVDGREVVAYDENAEVLDDFSRSVDAEGFADRVSIVGPDAAASVMAGCDRVVVSPGVPLNHPLVEAARGRGIPVDSEIEAAFHYTRADIVGVTGTNGKSTTVGVIGNIFEAAGVRSVVAGNVGKPFADVVGAGGAYETIVLELSSFQLDTITEFKVDVAVLLNVTPDHLDRYHHSFDEYAESKSRILNRANTETWFVYNADDRVCRRIADGFGGNKMPFSSSGRPDSENAVFLDGGEIVRLRGGDVEKVIAAGEFTPVGVHNMENAMASVGAATAMDVSLPDIRGGLRTYRPLPHRMELVRVVGGVAYINDSKATNVDATVKSLMGIDGGVALILGGKDKEGVFKMLIPHLEKARKVILIGEAAGVIRAALEGHCDMEEAADMAAAVGAAAKYTRSGDTVLLAPACASFDMFDNYQHRGEVFRSCVNALEHD
jgi:UDP-N-acetylmuramoylalanine--D-glutamate ligase